MKSIQTFLEEFNYIPFEEKPKILLQAWYKFFAIKHAQSKDSNELFQKLLEDLKELAEYVNSSSRDRPNFFDNNEDHYVQNKEYSDNSSNEIAASSSNQEKEGPSQDSDIQLVEICRQKELLCMHDNVDDLIESALNSKLLSFNSQCLNKEKQEVKNAVEQPAERRTLAPILSTKEPEYSPSMGENEVTSKDKRECDMPVCEKSPICDDHFEIFSDSKNNDDISSDDDDFEDIEYVEASLSDPEIVSVEEENVVYQEEEEVDLEDTDNSLSDNYSPEFETFCDHTEETRSGNTTTHIDNSLPENDLFCFEIEPDQERLINVVKNDISDDSSNDLFWKKPIYFLLSIIRYHWFLSYPNLMRMRVRFLEELLIDDSIPNNESSEYDFDNPSFPRPPPEPPDAEFDVESDSDAEISVVMKDNDELDCLDLRNEFDDDDYSSFMFVIFSKMFHSFLSAESEDTIFDPGISV
nr:hypothetical protein [Tanacetum cinerariifolium]